MITKWFAYIRKSTDEDDKQVMSMESQLFELNEFTAREKIVISEIFQESRSAKIPGRLEFNKMLSKIYASKEPVGIIAWHPDRLARNSIDGGQIIYLIDIKKVGALRFPSFWFEPTPQGLFMLNMAFGQSKYFSDTLSENVKRGIRTKLRRGEFGFHAPHGYFNHPKTRNIAPDPIKSVAIQRLFKEYAEHKFDLNGARFKLKQWGIADKNGNALTSYRVYRVLSNSAYIGLIKHKKEYHQGNYQPLIDKSTFDAVQQVLKQRSRPRKTKLLHDFPFRGLFHCGECGAQITAQFAKQGKYRYYRCTKKMGKCSQGYLEESKVVEQLKEYLKMVAVPKFGIEVIRNEMDNYLKQNKFDLKSFEQNAGRKQNEIDTKLNKLVDAYTDGDIERENYLKKKNKLMQERADIKMQREGFGQKGSNWLELMKNWLQTAEDARLLLEGTGDYDALRKIMEVVGSNRLLRGKKIKLDFQESFAKAYEYRVVEKISPADLAGLKAEQFVITPWVTRGRLELPTR